MSPVNIQLSGLSRDVRRSLSPHFLYSSFFSIFNWADLAVTSVFVSADLTSFCGRDHAALDY